MSKNTKKEKKAAILDISVMLIALTVVVVIAGFFFAKAGRNPLEGAWNDEEDGYSIRFENGGRAKLVYESDIAGGKTEVGVEYVQDEDNYLVTIMFKKDEINNLAKALGTTADDPAFSKELMSIQKICSTYNYEITGRTLVMYDSEMGKEYTFTRK